MKVQYTLTDRDQNKKYIPVAFGPKLYQTDAYIILFTYTSCLKSIHSIFKMIIIFFAKYIPLMYKLTDLKIISQEINDWEFVRDQNFKEQLL